MVAGQGGRRVRAFDMICPHTCGPCLVIEGVFEDFSCSSNGTFMGRGMSGELWISEQTTLVLDI